MLSIYEGIVCGPSMLADRPGLLSTLSALRKHLIISQLSFSLFFIGHHQPANLVRLRKTPVSSSRLRDHSKVHWSPSTGKPRKTPVFCQDFEIIRSFTGHHQPANS